MADSARTTSVDRRLVIHVAQAIPGDVPEEVIKAHLREAAHSHNLMQGILRVDPTRVDQEAFARVLRGEVWPTVPPMPIKEFRGGIIGDVHALGGQFKKARLITIPGGETLDSQRDRVIKFWTNWHFELKPEDEWRLKVEPSIASQVIYLENLIERSLRCSFEKTEEEARTSVQEILDSLPKVKGLRWIVGNAPTVNRVLAKHLGDHKVRLLPDVCTWTTDTYESDQYGLYRLFVGYFHSDGVSVHHLGPGYWRGNVGVFALGVPE